MVPFGWIGLLYNIALGEGQPGERAVWAGTCTGSSIGKIKESASLCLIGGNRP